MALDIPVDSPVFSPPFEWAHDQHYTHYTHTTHTQLILSLFTCCSSPTCNRWTITALFKAQMDSHSSLERWPTASVKPWLLSSWRLVLFPAVSLSDCSFSLRAGGCPVRCVPGVWWEREFPPPTVSVCVDIEDWMFGLAITWIFPQINPVHLCALWLPLVCK